MPKRQITIPVFVPHLGCPHRCIFCNQTAQTGTNESEHDIDELIRTYRASASKDIERIELAFFGGSFTMIEEKKKCAFLKSARNALDRSEIDGIRISTRPDAIDENELLLLKKYGVETIELGIQSFSDEVLQSSRRGHSAEQSRSACMLVRNHGFKLIIQLLPGLPGDSPSCAEASAREAASLQPHGVRIYPAVVFKETQLAELFLRGSYTPPSLDEAIENCANQLSIFTDASIPVIRIGVHPLESGSENKIIAGAYHPSLGFLVRSRLKRKTMETLLIKTNGSKVQLLIPQKNKEEYIGKGKENIRYLEEKYQCSISYRIDERETPSVECV